MCGCEAVVSALNISRNSDFPWSALRTPKDLLSATMNNVIRVAGKHNISRVVIVSAWGVNETKKDLPWWFSWVINHSNISYAYHDHERQEQLLQLSDLNYTFIRPVGLTNAAKGPVKISFDNLPKPSITISRKSVAAFTVDVTEQGSYARQAPVISGL